MEILYLTAVFLVIVAIIWARRPLYLAMAGGILAAILLFKIPFMEALTIIGKQTIAGDTIDVLMSFYLIIFLQFMLEKRGRLECAKDAFNSLLQNRRVNTMIAPAIMGLLPSAAVMTVCADMVDKTCGNYMDVKSKTFVSCYYRHIPEMFLPTYPVVLMALTISGQNAGVFVISMIPLVFMAFMVVYFTYLRKLPKEMPESGEKSDRGKEILKLIKNLWTLIAVLLIIVVFNVSVCMAAPLVIVADLIIDRFQPEEIPDLIIQSAEPVLLGNMYLIMLFKAILSHTGVLGLLPAFFGQFPIPLPLVFVLLFFFGTVISGSQTMIALCLPMALAAFPEGGIPLLTMLMGVAWAAMQISPTHVCAFVAADYYHTTIGDIAVKGLPSIILFTAVCYGYGMFLGRIF